MLESIRVIQGGMGVYISTPFLARAVSTYGSENRSLGTVSGVAAPHVVAHILGRGDPGNHYRRALSHFPLKRVAERIIDKYFVPDGISSGDRYINVPVFSVHPSRELIELTIASNFALVWLAKEGHPRPISINYLEKIQLLHLYSIFGAMLAGVDAVTVGAGIPVQIPPMLDAFADGKPGSYRVLAQNATESITLHFDPDEYLDAGAQRLKRPDFIPIVSSDSLAAILAEKLPGGIQGFVIETAVAGGHNAAPRGNPKRFNERGEPVYGDKDKVNFEKLEKIGIPFWVGGATASPYGVDSATTEGAAGIQAGSIFALCKESGMDSKLASLVRRLGFRGELDVLTSLASPTGFPFKIVDKLPGTLSDRAVYERRKRICNAGYLVTLYKRPDGSVVTMCPAEPSKKHVKKGGSEKDTLGKICLCNGLLATASLGNPGEPPVVTLGDDVSFLHHLMGHEDDTYSASQALSYLLHS